jgi:hypothetical protein
MASMPDLREYEQAARRVARQAVAEAVSAEVHTMVGRLELLERFAQRWTQATVDVGTRQCGFDVLAVLTLPAAELEALMRGQRVPAPGPLSGDSTDERLVSFPHAAEGSGVQEEGTR